MLIHVLQHVAHEGPGAIADWATARGHELHIVKLNGGDALPELFDVDFLIVLGGPMSVKDDLPFLGAERQLIEACLLAGRPTLGICLGMQQMAVCLGAEVKAQREPEIGWWGIVPEVLPKGASPFPALPATAVFHWHGEGCTLPQNTQLLAHSAATLVQAFAFGQHGVGLQFHPEATPEWIADLASADGGALSQNSPYVSAVEGLAGSPELLAASHDYLYALLDYLAARPRSNYRRIECGYYDHIELSIMRRTRRALRLSTLTSSAPLADALLLDTRTARGEEFVRVDGLGWLRADRVDLVGVSSDGVCNV